MSTAVLEQALARARALLAGGSRRLLGLAGPPGAGKSSAAQWLARQLPGQAVVVPMDGFHLANVQLQRLGRQARKGAPDTFDGAGFVALLQRLRAPVAGQTVYAPAFERALDEPVAAAIAVPASLPLVIVEGNYLLLDEAPWPQVRAALDESWFVEVDPLRRHAQLLARHQRYGRSPAAAEAWIQHTDEPNARLIMASREHASYRLSWPQLPASAWGGAAPESLLQGDVG